MNLLFFKGYLIDTDILIVIKQQRHGNSVYMIARVLALYAQSQRTQILALELHSRASCQVLNTTVPVPRKGAGPTVGDLVPGSRRE